MDHASIQCDDPGASAAFYDAIVAPPGICRLLDFGSVVGFGTSGTPDFWIGPNVSGGAFRESHLAFAAAHRDAVRVFVDAAVDHGAEVLDEPRLWPDYDPDYFGAFVRDPGGNNVEAVCRAPR